MGQDKTTKQILEASLKSRKRTPLYNSSALKKISKVFNNWKDNKVKERERKNWKITPYTIMGSEIEKNLIYTQI